MKKIFCILMALIVCMTITSVPASAGTQSEKNNDIKYKVEGGYIYFDVEKGEITGCDEKVTSVTIPEKINKVKVTAIGRYAFSDCIELKSVVLPKSLKKIGDEAFYHCIKLESIRLPQSLKTIGICAFGDCFSLETISIPKSLTTINSQAFARCSSLKNISVKKGNKYFEMSEGILYGKEKNKKYTLIRCSADKKGAVSVKRKLYYIDPDSFSGCNDVTDIRIKKIGNTNCEKVKSMKGVISTGFKSIGGIIYSYVWYNWNGYKKEGWETYICPQGKKDKVSIYDKTKIIGIGSFRGCDKITDVEIPSNVAIIGATAFLGCKNINEITLPKSTVFVGEATFNSCKNMEKILIPKSVQHIDEFCFGASEKVTIFGYENSYAEQYAKENNIPFKSISGADEAVQKAIAKNVYINYIPGSSKVDKNHKLAVYYDDKFFVNSNSKYNSELSKASLGLAMASMSAVKNSKGKKINRDQNIKDALVNQLGFYDYQPNSYDVDLKDTSDKVASAFAHKTVKLDGKETQIVVVAVRSGGYGGEWESNGRVTGGYDSNLHNGFSSAALKTVEQLKLYMKKNNIDNLKAKVWITGFSRGGAVSNLIAPIVLEAKLAESENIYCYTFASPMTTKSKDKYITGIYNIINPIDIVPKVPLKNWSYGRYGTDLYIQYTKKGIVYKKMKKEFENMTGGEKYNPYNKHLRIVNNLIDAAEETVGKTEEYYGKTQQQTVSKALGKYIGGADSNIDFFGLCISVFHMDLKDVQKKLFSGVGISATKNATKDIRENGADCELFKQHWPETYMSWIKVTQVQQLSSL